MHRPIRSFRISAFLLVSLSVTASAATITVINTNDSGAGSLRQAVADAADGDVIDADIPGTITLTSGAIMITHEIEINGPSSGTLVVDADDNSRVFHAHGAAVTITDLTMRNGHAPDGAAFGGSGEDGGGVYAATDPLTLQNCIIENCVAGDGVAGTNGLGGDGGGVYSAGALTMTNCTVQNCLAGNGGTNSLDEGVIGGSGGGIYVQQADLHSFTDCLIDSNAAGNGGMGTSVGPDGNGGGVRFSGAVTFTRCTISNNQGGQNGGGAFSSFNDGTVTFEDCTIKDNDAGTAGGVYLYNTSATFTGCTFDGNTSGTTGGGILIGASESETVSFSNCTFSANVAGTSGGAIYTSSATTALDVLNCTVVENEATAQYAGGVYISSATVNIKNTIIANNTDLIGQPDLKGSAVSGGGNLIEDTTGATITGDTASNITGVDPALGALADNGGNTLTHALTSSSPCMDAGVVSGAPADDQRGVSRDAAPDMGAFEYARPSVTTSPVTGIAATSATGNGNVTSEGESAVTARGSCWNTSGSPTTSDSLTSDGTGTGVFTSSLTGLSPETTYYVRAYATNDGGTTYGAEVTFGTSGVAPTVTTTTPTSVASTSAESGGEVTDVGSSGVTARGVCWNTTGSPTTADSLTSDGTGTGVFTSSLSGLSPETTYYVRAYATNSIGTSYGSQETFDTLAPPPPPADDSGCTPGSARPSWLLPILMAGLYAALVGRRRLARGR